MATFKTNERLGSQVSSVVNLLETGGGNVIGQLPLPDIKIIHSIVVQRLESSHGIRIETYKEGQTNMIYAVFEETSNTLFEGLTAAEKDRDPEYLFRVSRERDPYLRVASEAATHSFIRKSTSIPVPEIVAYDCDKGNQLGHAWILSKFLPGVALHKVFNKAPYQVQVRTIERISAYMEELSIRTSYPHIGSFYHVSDILKRGNLPGTEFTYPDPNQMVIGPLISRGGEGYGVKPAGMPHTSSAYLKRTLDDQIESFHAKQNLSPEQRQNIIKAIGQLQTCLHELLAFQPCTHFCLHHCDFHEGNVIIDPTTYQVTGIIDWEGAQVLPSWAKSKEYSTFMADDHMWPGDGEVGNGLRDRQHLRAWMGTRKDCACPHAKLYREFLCIVDNLLVFPPGLEQRLNVWEEFKVFDLEDVPESEQKQRFVDALRD